MLQFARRLNLVSHQNRMEHHHQCFKKHLQWRLLFETYALNFQPVDVTHLSTLLPVDNMISQSIRILLKIARARSTLPLINPVLREKKSCTPQHNQFWTKTCKSIPCAYDDLQYFCWMYCNGSRLSRS